MRYLSDASGVTVIHEAEVFVVPTTDVTYPAIYSYLIENSGTEIEKVRELFVQAKADLIETAENALEIVDGDDTTGEDSDKDAAVAPYRVVHGDPVSDVVFRTAVRAVNDPAKSDALKAFLRRLKKNPSKASRSQLFSWLAAEGFTLTTDGLIVGYKGVSDEYKSLSFGHEPVTVSLKGHPTITHRGYIPYPIGAVVRIPRKLVDEDRDAACSVGLHVGTYTYARGFGNRVLLVLVDPAHVVSVPRDANAHKMRVSKLTVASEYTGESAIDDEVVSNPIADTEKVRKPKKSKDEPKADPEPLISNDEQVVEAPDELAEKLQSVTSTVLNRLGNDGPQSKRDLVRRLSVNRRGHLDVVLESLVADKSIVREANGKYRINDQ